MHKHLAPGEGIDLVVAAVVGDAGAGDARFGLAQEVERRVRTFWEVGHPPVGQDAEEGGDGALHDEHPLPAFEAVGAVEQVEPVVYEAACGEHGDFAALHEREADLLLFARVPDREDVGEARVDARHGDSEEDAQGDHLPPGLHEGGAKRDDAEADGDEGEPDTRAKRPDGDCRGKLESDARNREDEDGN